VRSSAIQKDKQSPEAVAKLITWILVWTPVLETAEESFDSAPTHQTEFVGGEARKVDCEGLAVAWFGAIELAENAKAEPTKIKAITTGRSLMLFYLTNPSRSLSSGVSDSKKWEAVKVGHVVKN
jgi:hypothetical protein